MQAYIGHHTSFIDVTSAQEYQNRGIKTHLSPTQRLTIHSPLAHKRAYLAHSGIINAV